MAIAVHHDELIDRQPTIIPEGPLTWDEVQTLPDDGRRFELVDGVLLVTFTPATAHQRAATRLVTLLSPACSSGEEVFFAPYAWYLSEHTVFQPDVMIVRSVDLTAQRLEGAPRLAIEILSPSTKLRDLGLKRRYYGDAGLTWYWIVDPKLPRLTVLRLEDGRFVEHAVVTGDEEYEATEPVKVTVVPSALVS